MWLGTKDDPDVRLNWNSRTTGGWAGGEMKGNGPAISGRKANQPGVIHFTGFLYFAQQFCATNIAMACYRADIGNLINPALSSDFPIKFSPISQCFVTLCKDQSCFFPCQRTA